MGMEKTSMRDMVIAVGGPLLPGENRKSWLVRVANAAGISTRVARAAFYEETSSQSAARKLQAAAKTYGIPHLAAHFENLATQISQQDPEFHGPYADACRDISRILRGLPNPTGSADSE